MKIIIGIIGILIILAIGFLLTALSASTVATWVFGLPFSEAWSLCFERWYVLIAWAFLFGGSASVVVGSSNRSR